MGEITVTDVLLGEVRAMRAAMDDRLDKLVTTDAFTAEKERTNERHAGLAADIATERTERKDAQAKAAAAFRWLWASILLPIGLFVAGLYFASKG